MKNKRLAALAVALVIILSCGFSAYATVASSIVDTIDNLKSVDYSKYTQYSADEWNSLSSSERSQIINSVISDQKGTGYITSDYCNDSSTSLSTYSDLICNSFDSACDSADILWNHIYLEAQGFADFGMGYFSSSGGSGGNFGHSSGKFGDGTVADTLNDDFLGYIQNNPYPESDVHKLTSGDYSFVYGAEYFDYTTSWNAYAYVKIFYKGDLVRDWTNYGYSSSIEASGPYSHYNALKSNMYFDYSTNHIHRYDRSHWDFCFDLSPYITSDVIDVPNSPPAVGTDEDGNQIQLYLNSDGVTYEGSTYNYNNDNSVTIGGKTYYISVNPSDVDDDYYKQFLDDTINNYYNYYTTEGKEFDDTDIISALKSIFSSVETFRSYCYSQLKQLYDSVRSVIISISQLGKKLDVIINQLKSISRQLDDITEEQEQENKLQWLDLIGKFKTKIGWNSLLDSMGNISTGFFGTRNYTVNESGGINVSITSLGDSTVTPSSMPSLSVEFMGNKYDLYTCLGYLNGIGTIKEFISLFLWAGFLVSLFRSIPSIIGGVASVQDHSNNVVIDKNTGEVKWGA